MRKYLGIDENFQSYLDTLYTISHSEGTLSMYQSGLRQFQKFVFDNHHIKLPQLIVKIKKKQLDAYEILQAFAIYLDKKGKKASSIKSWMSAVKGYLRHVGIKIYSEDFKQSVRLPKVVRQREEPLTREILVRVLHSVPMKLQTIILVAVASGMRVGEIVQLRISDIDFSVNPTTIRIRGETTKTRESREAFLTAEATRMLKDYLTRFFEWNENVPNVQIQNAVIFGSTIRKSPKAVEEFKSNPTRRAISNLATSLRKYVSRIPDLAQLNENGRKMIHFHACRTFFRTVVGNAVGRDFAEAVIGHRFYLDSYYNLPKEKRREMYLKAEPHLTISDYTKIERELFDVKERQNEIQAKHLELVKMMQQDHFPFPHALEKYTK